MIPCEAVPCKSCAGTGQTTTISGKEMRKIRERVGIGLRAMAERIDVSPAYLSDLELGRRIFSEWLAEKFLEEVRRG